MDRRSLLSRPSRWRRRRYSGSRAVTGRAPPRAAMKPGRGPKRRIGSRASQEDPRMEAPSSDSDQDSKSSSMEAWLEVLDKIRFQSLTDKSKLDAQPKLFSHIPYYSHSIKGHKGISD